MSMNEPYFNNPVLEYRFSEIFEAYFSNLSTTCDFSRLHPPKWFRNYILPLNRRKIASAKHKLKEMFLVPRLNSFHQTRNRINRFHLLEAFLSLLLQLLYHLKTPPIVAPLKDQIENLEKELRYLHTILGDISWMMCDADAEFEDLFQEFETVANEAGSFVHSLCFSYDLEIEMMDKGLADVFKDIDLLKPNLESYVRIASYKTPATSAVDSIIILNSVVDDVEDLLKREDDPIAHVKEQLTLLHHELLLSHSLIKDIRSPQPEELKEPLMRIGGIAHQTEYLITSFLVKDAPLWYVFNRLTHLSCRVKPIRTEIHLIKQNYQFGGSKVEEYNLRAAAPSHDKRNTEVNDVIVGYENKTIEILDQLVGGGIESLQVISILGMPGLGKTTLANKLYNHPSVCHRFDKRSWCVVSQTYKRQRMLADILINIDSELSKDDILNMEEISLVEHIHKTLIGRRYLIVLDDVWDSNVLDELLRCFPDDHRNRSRILVTSRNKDVAPLNSILHELPFLTDEQCWELLEKKVFGSRGCPLELHEIGKKIAAKCCGIPLTIVVIAGVLSTVDEKESSWEEVRGRLASYFDGEEHSVMQILELSYKHLPDHLKPCFLYFGEFREDEEISVGDLKRLWVAEGFIQKENGKSAENVAGEYLMELIDKSLVMVGKRRRDGRGVKTCVIHDLLHELCLKICKEESFLKYWNIDYHTTYEKGHRLRTFGRMTTLSYCQHVRSSVANYSWGSFYVRDMRLLRVLHFNAIYLRIIRREFHIFGAEYLVKLRYLVINTLPTWIHRLENLEYVRIFERTYLPPTILKMKKLRYLCARSALYGKDLEMKKLIYQTNNLEYLSLLIIRDVEDEELLKCSPHLRKLSCTYQQEGTDESADPNFDLSFLTQLDKLSLSGFLISTRGFRFPSNIRKLTLCSTRLPWEKMSIVGRLQNLNVLKLLGFSVWGKRWDTGDGEFQNLRVLQLESLGLFEWNVTSNEHFPKLEQLILINCEHLQEIPGEIGEITTLELIEVKGICKRSLVESAERIKQEQRDMGNDELQVIISGARCRA